jgi:hypothetical protein
LLFSLPFQIKNSFYVTQSFCFMAFFCSFRLLCNINILKYSRFSVRFSYNATLIQIKTWINWRKFYYLIGQLTRKVQTALSFWCVNLVGLVKFTDQVLASITITECDSNRRVNIPTQELAIKNTEQSRKLIDLDLGPTKAYLDLRILSLISYFSWLSI